MLEIAKRSLEVAQGRTLALFVRSEGPLDRLEAEVFGKPRRLFPVAEGEEEGRLRVAEARRAAAESAGRDRVRGEAAKASRDIAATLRRARAQLGRAASPAPRAPAPAAPAAPAAPEAPAPEAPAPGTGWVPSVGDAVVVSQMGKRGKVMGVQGKGAGATCTVQVGLLQVKASPGELRKA